MSENKSPIAEIWEAISEGDIDETRRLFVRYPDKINAFIPFGGGTFLHLAASKQNVEMIELLIGIGFDINKNGRVAGDTALTTAASYGNYPVAKYLLDHGAEMDTESPEKNPLFGAIIGSSLEIAKLLLDRGIDSGARYTGESMKGMDAIAFALERGERDIAATIAKRNSDGDALKAEDLIRQGMEVALANNRGE
jgi:ankyrin repeat protein